MQQNLMKKTAIYSILFSAAALGVIFYAVQTEALASEESAKEEIQLYQDADIDYITSEDIINIEETQIADGTLTFEIGGSDTNYLCIPLPQGVKAEEIAIENHYMDGEMWIALSAVPERFYEESVISGNRQNITGGTYEKFETGVILKFGLKDIYECRSILEDSRLYIELVSPKEMYDKIIVVDPSFGGKAPGVEEGGLKEKDITLTIAEKLKAKLDTTDIKVYYTRMEDTNPTEEQRVKIANTTKADMLIRIEANADNDSNIYGTTAVYNANFFIPGFGSIELANLLEKEVVSYIKGKAIGLQAADGEDYVVMQATVPAAAIKVGYLTNAQEAILLKKEDYLDKIATGIYNAVMKVYEE